MMYFTFIPVIIVCVKFIKMIKIEEMARLHTHTQHSNNYNNNNILLEHYYNYSSIIIINFYKSGRTHLLHFTSLYCQ
jgi:sortase (surface protein transpeptidase)